jgi:hypothetical protein
MKMNVFWRERQFSDCDVTREKCEPKVNRSCGGTNAIERPAIIFNGLLVEFTSMQGYLTK